MRITRPARGAHEALLALSIVLALAGVASGHVVPGGVQYQGLATDADGVPLDGLVDLHFAIHVSPAGGTPLWSETHEGVMVLGGLFQVELGSITPLDTLDFDAGYYLAVAIDDDAEMTPRLPLTSVLYALRAEDANRLQGLTSVELDQSAHVLDRANPHAVTAGQVGAVDEALLDAHTENQENPHAVSAAQVGAATSKALAIHDAEADAHHTRYTGSEARLAMGLAIDTNSLNHARYTDAEVLAVAGAHVTSVDGLGGGAIDGAVRISRVLTVEDGVEFGDGTLQETAVVRWGRISVAPKGGQFTSIQEAIDSIEPEASSPWRIDVAPGSYREVLTLKSHLHLAGAGIRGTVVVLGDDGESGVALTGLEDVTISDLTIIDPIDSPNANHGIDLRASQLRLVNVRIEGFRKHRIRATAGSRIDLHHGEIDGGFESDSAGIALLESSAMIHESDFDRNVDCGIEVQQAATLDVSNSRFVWSPDGVCVTSATAHARIIQSHFVDSGVASQGISQIIGNQIDGRVFVDGGEQEIVGNRIDAMIEFLSGQGRISANRINGAGIRVIEGDAEIVGNFVAGDVTNERGSIRSVGNRVEGALEIQSGARVSQVVGNQIEGPLTVNASNVLVFGNHAPGATTGDVLVSRNDLTLTSEEGGVKMETISGNASIAIASDGTIMLESAGNIEISATGTLSLRGGAVAIESDGALDIRASSEIDIEGSAGAELSTGGILDLKGSLININ